MKFISQLKSGAIELRRHTSTALVCALLAVATSAHAQNYPNKRISLVVPWPAGGSNDVIGRIIAHELNVSLGQPVIVENIVGAAGTIGTTKALQAPADGHTILLTTQQDLVMGPLSYKSANYKTADVQTVAMLGHGTFMMVVRPTLAVQTMSDLVNLMKSSSDKPLSYCTPGAGSIYQLMVDRMNRQVQTKNLQVPYPGFGKCLPDMVGGLVDFAILPIAAPFTDFVASGKVRGLAVFGDKPNSRFPNLPLVSASKGLEGMAFSGWFGIHVNSAVPAPVVEQLNKAVLAALTKPEVRNALEASGGTIFHPMTPQQAQAYYIDSAKQIESMAQASGVTKQ